MRTAYVVPAVRSSEDVTLTKLALVPYETQRLSPSFMEEINGPRSPDPASLVMLRIRCQVELVGKLFGVCMVKLMTNSDS